MGPRRFHHVRGPSDTAEVYPALGRIPHSPTPRRGFLVDTEGRAVRLWVLWKGSAQQAQKRDAQLLSVGYLSVGRRVQLLLSPLLIPQANRVNLDPVVEGVAGVGEF